MQPVRDTSEGWVVFFIAFMVMGSLFIMNLFVGVVIDNFNKMKEEMGENMLLTEAQREWVKAQEVFFHVKPKAKVGVQRHACLIETPRHALSSLLQVIPPSGRSAQLVFRLITSSMFETAIITCIITNTFIMAMRFFGMVRAEGVSCRV